jgi:hypothetical protein
MHERQSKSSHTPLESMKLFILGFFEVILEVFNLEVVVLEARDLEVVVIVHTREDVGNNLGILVVHEEVRQGGTKPVIFLPFVFFPPLALLRCRIARTAIIFITMILTPSLVVYPIIPVILALMLPKFRPMGVINPTGSPTAFLVVVEIFSVFHTAMLLAGSVRTIIVILITTAIRLTPRLIIFPIISVMKAFLTSPRLVRVGGNIRQDLREEVVNSTRQDLTQENRMVMEMNG